MTDLPLVGQPFRQLAYFGLGQIHQQLCEIELGIDIVPSPRHADLLLVTGIMTRNLEAAARLTYEAMPEPRLVVAVGACAISGGPFAGTYAGRDGIGDVLPIDIRVPGCPPRPEALIEGLLAAVGRLPGRIGEMASSG